MDASNYFLLNRVFTRNTFRELIEERTEETYVTAIKRYINDPGDKNNQQLISQFYYKLKKNYRNEYFYKNTLLNKLLLGVHSPKTTTALTEVPVFKSKADFVLINGKAVVYEIKTELDTFERLSSQISDYYKAFNNVCVVTCESNYKKLDGLLRDTSVGIYILTDRNTISARKEPVEDNSTLDYSTMFKILRKKEFENILLSHYKKLPITNQVNYYDECFELFKSIDINMAHKYILTELKKRNIIQIEEYEKYVPYELKFLIYFSKYKKCDYIKLNNFLKDEFGG